MPSKKTTTTKTEYRVVVRFPHSAVKQRVYPRKSMEHAQETADWVHAEALAPRAPYWRDATAVIETREVTTWKKTSPE